MIFFRFHKYNCVALICSFHIELLAATKGELTASSLSKWLYLLPYTLQVIYK